MRDEGREIGTSVRDHVRDTLDRLVKRGVSGHVWTRVLRGVYDQTGVRVYDEVYDRMYEHVIRKW
jgi:hypothetical protein